MKRRRVVLGAVSIVKTIVVVFTIIMLSVTLMWKRDSQATSMTTKVLLNALATAGDSSTLFTVWDVSKLIRDKIYPMYLKCFLDAGGRIMKNSTGGFDPRNNFTAFGAYNLMSPLRLRQIRVKSDVGCSTRQSKFKVIPCISEYEYSKIDKGFINKVTTLWLPVVKQFEYRKPSYESYVSGVMQTASGADISYPNEGHIYVPDITESIMLMDQVSMARTMSITTSYLAANKSTSSAEYVAEVLAALQISDADIAAASTAGLTDLLAGPEDYQKNNDPRAPKEKGFLSEYTRVLFVEVDVLNANRDNPSVASVIIMFEFSPFGGVYVTFKLQTFTVVFHSLPLDHAVIGMLFVWIILHVASRVVDRPESTVLNKIRRCCTFQMCLLLSNFGLFCAYVGLCDALQPKIDEKIDVFLAWKRDVTNPSALPPFPDFGDLYSSIDAVYVLATVILLFAATSLMLFLGTYEVFGRYIRLFSAGAGLLVSFSTLFVITIVFYAMCMHLQLAPRVNGFEDVGQSILSTFRMLVGDFPYDIKKDDIANVPIFAMVAYVSFSILYVWIGLNVFVAIVSKAHELALESKPENTVEEAVMDFVQYAICWVKSLFLTQQEMVGSPRPHSPKGGNLVANPVKEAHQVAAQSHVASQENEMFRSQDEMLNMLRSILQEEIKRLFGSKTEYVPSPGTMQVVDI